jgi:hypothetical protein
MFISHACSYFEIQIINVAICTEKFKDLSAIEFLLSLEYSHNIDELGVVLD